MATSTTHYNLVKPAYSESADVATINDNMDEIDAQMYKNESGNTAIENGIAIVSVGDTHGAITSGQYVYVKEHNTLPEGMYIASSNIAANAALSTSNLTTVSSGALNALSDQIGTLNGKIGTKFKYTYVSVAVGTGITPIGGCAWRSDYKSIGAGKKIVSVIPRAYIGGLFIPVVRYDSRDQFCLFGTYSENIICDVIYADSGDIT